MKNISVAPAFFLGQHIMTVVDLDRAIRDLRDLDDSFRQHELRSPGEPTIISKINRTLEDLARDNNLTLLDPTHRDVLIKQLQIIREHAPVVHMSFPSEPSRKALDTITTWFRVNVDPYMLLQVGLEPVIGIGCIVRTTNKIIDCSLKHTFKEKKHLLKKFVAPKSTNTQPQAGVA
jgi:hypothetical protein